jgi:hypothetical protein
MTDKREDDAMMPDRRTSAHGSEPEARLFVVSGATLPDDATRLNALTGNDEIKLCVDARRSHEKCRLAWKRRTCRSGPQLATMARHPEGESDPGWWGLAACCQHSTCRLPAKGAIAAFRVRGYSSIDAWTPDLPGGTSVITGLFQEAWIAGNGLVPHGTLQDGAQPGLPEIASGEEGTAARRAGGSGNQCVGEQHAFLGDAVYRGSGQQFLQA